jgi:CTP:molybdopterin cytidylyltransferase MocA
LNARYAAIVLAGGLSTRMKQFKPLLSLGDTTITDHVIGTFLSAGADVFLIAGYRHDDIVAGIKKRDITIVYNPDYEKGMFSSVQAGVRHLDSKYQAFFINPVDIPLVRPATVRKLMEAVRENPDNITYPVFLGKRGHPPLIPSALIPDILGWEKDGSLKAVLKAHEKRAMEVPVADSYILYDIDTPEDYEALMESYRRYEVPTDEECQALIEIYQMPPEKIRHGHKTADVAVAIGRAMEAAGHKLDIELVYIAAKLHDIAKGQRKHDIAGGKILQELGFGKVGNIVAVHSDLAGGDKNLPLEHKIVYLTDKFVGGEKLVSLKERYHHPDFTPEAQAAAGERLKVALEVKHELENLLGYPLESIFPDKSLR